MDEQEALWRNLCDQAWNEQDPVNLLDITMQITRFPGRKQERLDRERRVSTFDIQLISEPK